MKVGHTDVDLKSPPRRRIGAVVLVRDPQNRVLLVLPTYQDHHQLPGGGAHGGEHIAVAASRELKEETGLDRTLTHFVALDQVPPDKESEMAEGINIVFDGGTLTADEAASVAVPDEARDELKSCAWVRPSELDDYCEPYQVRRIREALTAVANDKALPLLVMGELVGA